MGCEPGKRCSLSLWRVTTVRVYVYRPSIVYIIIIQPRCWRYDLLIYKRYTILGCDFIVWVLRRFNSVMVSFCSGMPICVCCSLCIIYMVVIYYISTGCPLCRVHYNNIIAEAFEIFSVNCRETIVIHGYRLTAAAVKNVMNSNHLQYHLFFLFNYIQRHTSDNQYVPRNQKS